MTAKRCALIENGLVVNVIRADPETYSPPPGQTLRDVEGVQVNIGDGWDGEQFIDNRERAPELPITAVHIAWLEQALLEIGKLDAVNAAVAADPVKASLWRRVVTVNRNDPDVIAVAAALDIDLDALFARADAIRRERQPSVELHAARE